MRDFSYLVSIQKWSFCPISALCSKNNPRNIKHIPVVIFFAGLDLKQKGSSLDEHCLVLGVVCFGIKSLKSITVLRKIDTIRVYRFDR
jgi:hypothetical protein